MPKSFKYIPSSSADIKSSAHMKRTAEWANPLERCRKIPVPPAWPAGCPHCSKTHLSWNEWGCYCTILQDDESENMYWSCRSCMRVTMQKHYQFMKWWKWGGEGDPQEQLATSSRIPISACEAMNAAIMSRHAPLSRSNIGTQTWSQLCALLFSSCFAVTMDCVHVIKHVCLYSWHLEIHPDSHASTTQPQLYLLSQSLCRGMVKHHSNRSMHVFVYIEVCW